MPRSFDLTADSPHPAERIHAAFADENYWRARLSAFGTGSPTLESLTTGPDGTTTVTVSMHFGLQGRSVRIVQVETWRAAGPGILLGTITVDAPGAPVSGNGELSIRPIEVGSRMVGRGTVDVRVPVIGGAIAGVVAGQLATEIRNVHDFTDGWIDRDDAR